MTNVTPFNGKVAANIRLDKAIAEINRVCEIYDDMALKATPDNSLYYYMLQEILLEVVAKLQATKQSTSTPQSETVLVTR
jgi:hypothetical protein